MKFIITIATCLLFSVSGYSQKGKPEGRLFIKGVSGLSIKKSQLNENLEFATDIVIDTTITATVYWLDSTINKGRVLDLEIGKDKFIPANILEAWKKAPVKSKIFFTKAKYFDVKRNKIIKLDTDMYEIID